MSSSATAPEAKLYEQHNIGNANPRKLEERGRWTRGMERRRGRWRKKRKRTTRQEREPEWREAQEQEQGQEQEQKRRRRRKRRRRTPPPNGFAANETQKKRRERKTKEPPMNGVIRHEVLAAALRRSPFLRRQVGQSLSKKKKNPVKLGKHLFGGRHGALL